MKPDNSAEIIVVACLGASYGIQGWQRLHSLTDPPGNLLTYQSQLLWQVDGSWQSLEIAAIRSDDKGYLIKLPQVNSPEAAKKYANTELAVLREHLPVLKQDEFYCSDLIGLEVIDQNNHYLGVIKEVLATGSNDVLVLVREKKASEIKSTINSKAKASAGSERILLPYISQVIKKVDLATGKVEVSWTDD